MTDEIKVNKSTLLIGLFVIIAIGMMAFMYMGKGSAQPQTQTQATVSASGVQEVSIRALANGNYDKGVITVRKGIPVKLRFSADPNAGCGRQFVIFGMNVGAISTNGEEKILEFTPNTEGTYEYSCGMRMWGPGRLVVSA